MKHKRKQRQRGLWPANFRQPAVIVVAALFVAAGLIWLGHSRAASYMASAEAESGTVAGKAAPQDGAAGASGSKAVLFGGPTGGSKFPQDQSAPPDLSMIPSTAKKVATLDMNSGDWSQWGDTYGYCPPTTNFKVDRNVLRTPDSVASAYYMLSGVCDTIEGSGGDGTRRSEHSSREQDEYVFEGDERYYYISIKPAADMPTPKYNYFLVSQWHPEGDGSPVFSINFHNSGTVDIGEDHKLIIGDLHKGVWTDYVIHVRHSQSSSNGWIEVWENGVKKIQKTGFATMTDGSLWLKQGIYSSPKEGSTKHEVWFDATPAWKP